MKKTSKTLAAPATIATISLDRVATFVSVVRAGSFTAAGKALGVPTSSVSRRVAELEGTLGTRLLHRTTRKLHLSEAGQAFFERADAAINTLGEATEAVTDLRHAPRGVVRLACSVDLAAAVLPELLKPFLRRYPLIHVELILGARALDLAAEGIDLAVRVMRVEDSSLVVRRIAAGELGLFASPRYLRRRGTPRRIGDLARHEVVLFRARGGRDTWRLVGPGGEEQVDVHGRLTADDMTFMHRAALTDWGIAPIPPLNCRDDVAAGYLVRVLPGHAFRGLDLCAVMPSGRLVPARVLLLRDFLVEKIGALVRRSHA